jgi:hypothetical protein
MRVPIEAPLPLDAARDAHTAHRQPGPGRNPFRLLEPHGGDRRGMLDPTKPRLSRGILVLIGLENVGSATPLSAHGRGQPHPSIGLFGVGEGLHVPSQALACLQRGRVGLGGPPRLWTVPATARLVVRSRRNGGCASGLAGPTTKRSAARVPRPARYSPSTCRTTLWPCHWRHASSLVRPGCATRRGRADC